MLVEEYTKLERFAEAFMKAPCNDNHYHFLMTGLTAATIVNLSDSMGKYACYTFYEGGN